MRTPVRIDRREFVQALATLAGVAATQGRAAAQATARPLPSDPAVGMREPLAAYFDDLCAWIMGLDVGSNQLKGTKDTATSIFINGNFARVLMASCRITGNQAHLDEALRWGDTFCSIQQRTESSKGGEAGFWPDCGPQGNIYFGDAGTAAHALAALHREAAPERQATYRAAMERMARFVIDGCPHDPQGAGRDATPTWIIRDGNDAGAIGCGYYRGKLSTEPYTIATATTGTAFFSELFAITGDPEYKGIATRAVKWLLRSRNDDGEIPYTLAGQTLDSWPLDTMSYCTEAFIAADRLLDDDALRTALHRELAPSVQWLLAGQNPDGSWGALRSADQQRSPRAVSLLVWALRWIEPKEPVTDAIRRYCAFLLDAKNSKAYGVKELVRTTGFVGLALADMLKPDSTF
ncbi:MAG: hypothetical protein JXR94_16675 [Candidatus Hydrogenedentes bacterium]|nr:hypothetical protein [Candidatus Hydrogenedentota bacterium]